ncbi:MAG: trehalase [Herbinix sp.]|jgi:hypothetical glycosyl hydrolase|nr:trehalase [Herbinix sp.]
MIYYKVEKKDDQLYILEQELNYRYTLKTETNFAQCNGYLGVRAAFETSMLRESRGMFVAGFYHKAGKFEVAELVNCPDLVGMEITINEESFQLDTCDIHSFCRRLNLRTGELETRVQFDLANTKGIEFTSKRFVSMKNRQLICHQIGFRSMNDLRIEITTGINGQITNSGVSHFIKVENRVFDKKYMYTKNVCDDDQVFEAMTICCVESDTQSPTYQLKRRSLYGKYNYSVRGGERFNLTKFSMVSTGTLRNLIDIDAVMGELGRCETIGYQSLYEEHGQVLQEVYQYAKLEIDGATEEEEAAIAFAQYHLLGMVPYDTSDHSVAAKGLTGEGYKGHVFWDTEIFVMPFFTTVFPEIARNILTFRYHGLNGAREKAEQNDYLGAMYPWEVARSGSEETPLYAALNIHTGEAEKVWSGIKEHHITADIIYSLWNYYKLTKDDQFLKAYGYEMIIETATYWCSRAVWNNLQRRFEILDIIGPDEYTEHVDNNTYTNYMAYENVRLAYHLIHNLRESTTSEYLELQNRYNLDQALHTWREFIEHIYLPKPNDLGIIPQDDTFLSKKEIKDIEAYKNSPIKQSILLDYSREEIVNMQILKQADIVMLLNLMPDLFDKEIVLKNVRYYENRTIHDSSLSYSAHAIASAKIGDVEMAYDFFQKAMEIDLNDNYNDSTDGIHAAALGGIWNCIIQGFAGIQYNMDCVEITPHLPKQWRSLQFYLKVQDSYIKVRMTKEKVILEAERYLEKELLFRINGMDFPLFNRLEITLIETAL